MTVKVATFYKFVQLADVAELRQRLMALCRTNNIKGTILLASEGINATISGTEGDIDSVLTQLRSDRRFSTLVSKFSFADDHPFKRMKVRLKKEIVTLGAPEANPAQRVGIYVPPEDWNILLADPEVVLIDTRNSYEFAIGSFNGARDPGTRSFSEFRDYVKNQLDPDRDRRIAMYCTGGIRCEKATSYLLAHGFHEVYHLEGGILKYLETVEPSQSLWRGECFVFDERVALAHGVTVGSHRMCRTCGWPCHDADEICPNCKTTAE